MPTNKTTKSEQIDPRILEILGLQDVFDFTYSEYSTLLKEKMIQSRMSKSSISTERAELLTKEFKRIKNKEGAFKVKKGKINPKNFKSPIKANSQVKLLTGKDSGNYKSLPESKSPKNKDTNAPVLKFIANQNKNFSNIEKTLSTGVKTEKKRNKEKAKIFEAAEDKRKKVATEKFLESGPDFSGFQKLSAPIVKPVEGLFNRILKFLGYTFAGFVLDKTYKWWIDPANQDKVEKLQGFFTSVGEWFSNEQNNKKIGVLVKFLKDHWLVLFGVGGLLLLYNNAFFRFGVKLVGIISKSIIRLAVLTAKLIAQAALLGLRGLKGGARLLGKGLKGGLKKAKNVRIPKKTPKISKPAKNESVIEKPALLSDSPNFKKLPPEKRIEVLEKRNRTQEGAFGGEMSANPSTKQFPTDAMGSFQPRLLPGSDPFGFGFKAGGMVPVHLTKGEYIIPPNQAQKIGYSNLERINSIGNYNTGGVIPEKKSNSHYNTGGLIPGRGPNVDTVKTFLPEGSFVVQRPAVDKVGANSLQNLTGYASGGRVNLPGGRTANNEMDLFTRMVYAEAGGEGKTGMALVARAILNRSGLIKSKKVGPGTFNAKSGSITDVINGRSQFSPITDGRINQKLSESQLKQARDAISLASNPEELKSTLKSENISQASIKKLLAVTGFRTGAAFYDASQDVNVVKYKAHNFNTAGNSDLTTTPTEQIAGSGRSTSTPDSSISTTTNETKSESSGSGFGNIFSEFGALSRLANILTGTTESKASTTEKSNTSAPKQNSFTPTSTSSQTPTSGTTGNSHFIFGDSIASGLAGRQGGNQVLSKDNRGMSMVGASPSTVLGHIKSFDKSKLRGKIITLSSGISNNTSDLNSVQEQIKYLTDNGAKVRLVGVTNNPPTTHPNLKGINAKLMEITSKYNNKGVRFVGGFAPSGDGIHPANSAELNSKINFQKLNKGGISLTSNGGGNKQLLSGKTYNYSDLNPHHEGEGTNRTYGTHQVGHPKDYGVGILPNYMPSGPNGIIPLPVSGKVLIKENYPGSGYGNTVIVDTGLGKMQFSHLSNFGKFSVGDQLSAGTIIGTQGKTGGNYEEHLHLNASKKGHEAFANFITSGKATTGSSDDSSGTSGETSGGTSGETSGGDFFSMLNPYKALLSEIEKTVGSENVPSAEELIKPSIQDKVKTISSTSPTTVKKGGNTAATLVSLPSSVKKQGPIEKSSPRQSDTSPKSSPPNDSTNTFNWGYEQVFGITTPK